MIILIAVIHLTNTIIKLSRNGQEAGETGTESGTLPKRYCNCSSLIRHITPSYTRPPAAAANPTIHVHPRHQWSQGAVSLSLPDTNDDDIHLIIDNKLTGGFVTRLYVSLSLFLFLLPPPPLVAFPKTIPTSLNSVLCFNSPGPCSRIHIYERFDQQPQHHLECVRRIRFDKLEFDV